MLLLVAGASMQGARAQPYPSKPIHFIVPFAGGTTDALSRVLAQRLTERLGQPVVVENRPGADGIIATDAVTKATPDGHTIGFAVSSIIAVQPHTRARLPYHPDRDLTFVGQIAYVQFALAVHPSLKVSSVAELIELARSQPGRLTYASASEGGQIAGEMFKLATGTDIVQIPYKGGAPAVTDLLSGQVNMMFAAFGNAVPLFQSKRLAALAVTGEKRAAVLPAVPTMQEAGVKGYEYSSVYGIVAPRGVPEPAVKLLNAEIVAALGVPDIAERFVAQGVEPRSGTPEQYAAAMRAESQRYRELLPRIGIKRQ
jgi:tripartite-type tricarboxylate transporter receptor subunit TctC